MSSDRLEFYGLVFFSGQEFLPGDVLLDLDNLRRWALEQGLISDPDAQILVPERVQKLAKCFSSDDKLLVAISICESQGKLSYVEYPYLPVRSLIQRAEEVVITYWRMVPTEWDSGGEVLRFGEVRFGFWYPGCSEELCSLSTAQRVTAKFDLLLGQLSGAYEIESFKDGAKEITVGEAVRAKFFREGRLFDVSFSLAEQRGGMGAMRSEQEIKELVKELSRLTGFIGEFGTEEEFQGDDSKFCCNVSDSLYWVLGEISTERFRSGAYLNLAELQEVARGIEMRTGRKLEGYE